MSKNIHFILILSLMHACHSLKILIAVPNTPKSLSSIFITLGLGLAERNHSVTAITPYPLAQNSSRIVFIPLPKQVGIFDDNIFERKDISTSLTWLYNRTINVTHLFWSDSAIMALWNRRKEFDVIISMSYLNEMVFPFFIDNPAKFIQVCTPGVEYHAMTRQGNWLMPSVVPNILLNFDEEMSFWERAINIPSIILTYQLESFLSKKFRNDHLIQYFPEIEDLLSYYNRVALTLINGHFSLDGPVPLLPNQVEIGTINIKGAKPLDKNLAAFVEGSGEAGLVYFSLGSIAKSTDIPQNLKLMFVEVFRRIPQRVIWKYEGSDLDLPPNVLIRKWMPQEDILGHPKTKVFISHCGNLGTQEAKYYGVPVLGVPIAYDQHRNAARMARKGYAIVLQWEDMATEDILDSLEILINGTSYKERLQTISRVIKDQKERPIDRAIWWIEYIGRHKSVSHLRYAGNRLTFLQYFLIDVILFWIIVILLSNYILIRIIKAIFCRESKKTNHLKSKDKTL